MLLGLTSLLVGIFTKHNLSVSIPLFIVSLILSIFSTYAIIPYNIGGPLIVPYNDKSLILS